MLSGLNSSVMQALEKVKKKRQVFGLAIDCSVFGHAGGRHLSRQDKQQERMRDRQQTMLQVRTLTNPRCKRQQSPSGRAKALIRCEIERLTGLQDGFSIEPKVAVEEEEPRCIFVGAR